MLLILEKIKTFLREEDILRAVKTELSIKIGTISSPTLFVPVFKLFLKNSNSFIDELWRVYLVFSPSCLMESSSKRMERELPLPSHMRYV